MFRFNLISEKVKHPSQLPSGDNIKNSWNIWNTTKAHRVHEFELLARKKTLYKEQLRL